MTAEETEAVVLEEVARTLKAEGFEVYLHPKEPIRPAFLGPYTPDAIAIGNNKKIVIEVTPAGPMATAKLTKLTALVNSEPGWEFRAVVFPAVSPGLEIAPVELMRKRLEDARALVSAGQNPAALLVCWAVFEAFARRQSQTRFAKPQTPGRIVELLASDGTITPNEADKLRGLAKIRNEFIHGSLDPVITTEDVSVFINILNVLIRELKAKSRI